jgi:UDP-N-acetylglucosamine--N-acetylmuramyl-(pentapeptide) pyrophosphoryl-undecaprenol N-acetylglucosamine transferase
MDDRRVLIMAGGTGGHVFPALAVADCLRADNVQISWLGTRRGIESELVPSQGIQLHYLDIEGIRGRGLRAILKAPLLLWRSISQALKVLAEYKPGVVLGMGGFASGPGAVAARLKGIPVVIHEQNSVAGTTNKLSAKIATKVMQGFPDTLANGEWCGNPVRPEIANLPEPKLRFATRKGKVRLLVLGGSRGALAINKLLPEALARFDSAERPEVFHQAGKAHWFDTLGYYQHQGIDTHGSQVEVVPFIDDMAKAYSWADFVICRAGALTVAELTSAGLGSLLVPFPFAIDDHQTANGELLTNCGAALLFQQDELTASLLAEQIALVVSSPSERLRMATQARQLAKNHAAQRVAEVCLEVGYGA